MKGFQHFVLERAMTFEAFLENCDEEVADDDGRKWVYRNQIDYLTDSSGKLMVDFVGRFESFQKDFDLVATKLHGRRPRLPRNANKSRHRSYTDYYTPALARKVEERYGPDIEAFGYAFGE
jgi:hypothetical protein